MMLTNGMECAIMPCVTEEEEEEGGGKKAIDINHNQEARTETQMNEAD
jgi:hypothetical protein